MHNFSIGALGESFACEYLLQHNYNILGTNCRIRNNEIDIIALDQKNNEIVFVEVKVRKNSNFGNPEIAVKNKKIQSMNFVAREYIKSNHCNLDYRFDIIAITYLGAESDVQKIRTQNQHPRPQIEHFENVTWP